MRFEKWFLGLDQKLIFPASVDGVEDIFRVLWSLKGIRSVLARKPHGPRNLRWAS
jgi:hypothetical protein